MGRSLPDGRVRVLAHSSHSPFRDEPDAFFAAAATFLDERLAAKR